MTKALQDWLFMAKIKIGQKIPPMISTMNKGILLHREKEKNVLLIHAAMLMSLNRLSWEK